MGLESFWFVLIAVLWAGYFLLEGFDFGVGMLLPFLPRDERERGLMFESIGPVWDGNEVWLVVAAGATFAAFPAWYATMFSGFYIALLLILVLLIVRVVSFEWREKHDSRRWRATWPWANTIGSVGVAVHLGRRAGEPRARRAAGLLARLHRRLPRPVQRLHGRRRPRGRGCVRAPRSDVPDAADAGDFCERAAAMARRLSLPAAVLGIAIVAWTVAVAHDRNSRGILPTAVPAALTAVALILAAVLTRARRSGWAFAATGPGRDRLRRDDLHRPVSARARLGPDVRQQPHDRQRRGRALRAPGDHGRRRDLRAARPALPGLDLPRVPQAAGRTACAG